MTNYGNSDENRNFGYIYPEEWYNAVRGIALQGDLYLHNINASWTNYQGYSFTVMLSSWAYSFASAADEAATANVSQSGTVTFERGGITWAADYSQQDAPQLTLADKTTGTRLAVGADTTETATATGTIPAVEKRLAFRGSNGGVLWATVSLPAASLVGGTFQARSAYNGTAQSVGSVVAAGLDGEVEISEQYANVTIDPGLMTLVE
jgi:hypothetical protein